MEYSVYKLKFSGGVHFGDGMLDESDVGFCADTLFSALYIEAIKAGMQDELYNAVKDGRLLISDAFPYIEDRFFLPKPMIFIEHQDKGDSVHKKLYKKLKCIPADEFDNYLAGNADIEKCNTDGLGAADVQVMAAVRNGDEDTRPYAVGNYTFSEGSGLYVIIKYTDNAEKKLFEDLMDSLSYSGIGGKRSSGKGRFIFSIAGRQAAAFIRRLENKGSRYMLLSTALPQDDELDEAITGASYMLQKRSGFVYSENFADEQLKKSDLFTMKSGSCFRYEFDGDIYDVSGGRGRHPVYRYAKAMFMEV